MVNKQRVKRIKSLIYAFLILMLFLPLILVSLLTFRMLALAEKMSDKLDSFVAAGVVSYIGDEPNSQASGENAEIPTDEGYVLEPDDNAAPQEIVEPDPNAAPLEVTEPEIVEAPEEITEPIDGVNPTDESLNKEGNGATTQVAGAAGQTTTPASPTTQGGDGEAVGEMPVEVTENIAPQGYYDANGNFVAVNETSNGTNSSVGSLTGGSLPASTSPDANPETGR